MIYFEEEEFKMGNEIVFDKMQEDFLCLLDDLRVYVKEPLHITSSYRSESYNKSVGGSKTSQHLTGNAVDLHCNNGKLRRKIVQNALELGLSVGVAKNFIHIDNRLRQIVFTY
jgi:uncharacterized protein YcbK (DUF882 family)